MIVIIIMEYTSFLNVTVSFNTEIRKDLMNFWNQIFMTKLQFGHDQKYSPDDPSNLNLAWNSLPRQVTSGTFKSFQI